MLLAELETGSNYLVQGDEDVKHLKVSIVIDGEVSAFVNLFVYSRSEDGERLVHPWLSYQPAVATVFPTKLVPPPSALPAHAHGALTQLVVCVVCVLSHRLRSTREPSACRPTPRRSLWASTAASSMRPTRRPSRGPTCPTSRLTPAWPVRQPLPAGVHPQTVDVCHVSCDVCRVLCAVSAQLSTLWSP